MTINKIEISAILLLILILQSCATYKTIVPRSQKKLVQYVECIDNEKCVTIPRVYSGVNYTFCVMSGNAQLKSTHTDVAMIPFDFIADTLLLPHTITMQIVDGNLVLKKKLKSRKI